MIIAAIIFWPFINKIDLNVSKILSIKVTLKTVTDRIIIFVLKSNKT